jgi:hypothetical protein
LAGRIENELICLFGQNLVTQARRTDIGSLNLDSDFIHSISEIAGQLLKLSGYPQKQTALVDRLDRDRQLVLCAWIIDGDLPARLVGNW